ncbi:class I SAM-dependent methyltransferase [Candidatus Woesearchaeota archaeon]|nr:class I SAM-dependent methyltransferase [Candidatus Woesearchaeota archaeon]
MSTEQYNEIADAYSQMFNPTKKHVLIPTFKKLFGDVKDKSVLDLACGEGFFTRILAEAGASEVVGVDISKELIWKAVNIEKKNPLGIEYHVEDVLKMDLGKRFDLVTAVYLLNYAHTKEELIGMAKKAHSHLAENSFFCTITQNPDLKPMNYFEYDRRFTNVNGNKFLKGGDKVRCEIHEPGKAPFEFFCYMWSRKTYEECLKAAGFKAVSWVDAIISDEGIKEYGSQYWDKFRKNPSPIGIICTK